LKFPVNVGEAAIVNQVFDLYAKQRLGVVSVARWLNENGYIAIETATSGGLMPSTEF
jgi:predicted AlkP superfamily phosphohydrolase/phosphomutase